MANRQPKHKPNKKHTLDEVLKSLQDLVRNDVLDHAGSPSPHHKPAPTAETVASMHAIIDSLEDLLSTDLDPNNKSNTTPAVPEPKAAPATAKKPDRVTEKSATQPASAKTPRPQPELAENDLPTIDVDETPLTAEEEAAYFSDIAAATDDIVTAPAPADNPHSVDFTSVKTKAEPKPDVLRSRTRGAAKPPGPAARATDQPSFDDIPVLDDVALAPPPQTIDLPLPPSPDPVRELAVRVIARLNIELRKEGEKPLGPKIVMRLQQLLKEALEGENSDK